MARGVHGASGYGSGAALARPAPGLGRAAAALTDRAWFGYVLAAPALALIGFVIFYPVVAGIALSFTDRTLVSPLARWVGAANYRDFFGSVEARTALWHSVQLTVAVVVLQYGLGLGLAFLLLQPVRGIGFFRSVTMASWVIPVVATVLMFEWMAEPNHGFFNVLLESVGLGRYATYWFGSERWAMPMILLMHLWRNVPFYGIALMAAMQSIPRELYEAADLDGAARWARFVHVTWPGIRYLSMVMVVIHVLWTFNNFDFVYLSTGGGPVDATLVLPVWVYRRFWEHFQVGYAAAGGVAILLALLVFTALYVRLVREREV